MANSLTNYGQAVMLQKDAAAYRVAGASTNIGGLIKLAAKLKLYTSASAPTKSSGSNWGLTEVANGNGYTTGGIAIVEGDWTLSTVSGNAQVQLADQVWTATGAISNIAGAYITDANDNVLGWWERATPISLVNTDTFTADDILVRPT